MKRTMNDEAKFASWTGNQEVQSDQISLEKVRLISATFDLNSTINTGQELPPLWHWCFFNPKVSVSQLGNDGHPIKGDFLPPIPFPRRMWAGGQLEFNQLLKVGEIVNRVSTIEDVSYKSGSSGKLVFVKVRHEITGDQGGHIIEHQDLVYREAPSKSDGAKVPEIKAYHKVAQWKQKFMPDSVLLFRYSALTFNSHRIHYDREYSILAENYPGLVVHGPLTATLLSNFYLSQNTDRPIKKLSFRATRPLFDRAEFTLNGRELDNQFELWALTPEGEKAMGLNIDV